MPQRISTPVFPEATEQGFDVKIRGEQIGFCQLEWVEWKLDADRQARCRTALKQARRMSKG